MASVNDAWSKALQENGQENAILKGHAWLHYMDGDNLGAATLVLGTNLRLCLLAVAMRDCDDYDKRFGNAYYFTVHAASGAKRHYGTRLREETLRTELKEYLTEAAPKNAVPGRTVDQFLYAPFSGTDAPQRFVDWVKLSPIQAIGRRSHREDQAASRERMHAAAQDYVSRIAANHGHDFFKFDECEDSVKKILAHLSEVRDAKHRFRHRMMCVHADGMPFGMTALAHHILKRKPPDDPRPWLYLPLHRGVTAARVGDSCNDTTYRATVARLNAFFRGSDIATADPEQPDETTEDRLSFIRKKMMERATVLIFDGYQENSVGDGTEAVQRPALTRLIRDEPLVLLLQKLLRPRPGIWMGEGPTASFNGTRILVLGDTTVTPLAGKYDELAKFPRPEEGYVSRLVGWLGNGRESEFLKRVASTIVHRLGESTSNDDDVLRAMALIRRYGIPDDARPAGQAPNPMERAFSVRATGRRDFALNRALVEMVSGLTDSDVPDLTWSRISTKFLAFMLLALSDTGLRSGTLERIVARTIDADGRTRSVTPKEAAAALESLEVDLPRIVVSGEDEVMARLHTEPQGLEYDPPGWIFDPDLDTIRETGAPAASEPPPELARPDSRIWEIPDIRLRKAFKDRIHTKAPDLARKLHLLMAEESLQQHAVMLRNSPSRKFLGLRYHRRAVEGILHGLESLTATEVAVGTPPSNDRFPVRTSMVPYKPVDRLLSLYSDYLQSLEHGTDFHLARMWGADEAKKELLETFVGLCAKSGTCAVTRLVKHAQSSLAKVDLSLNGELDQATASSPKSKVDAALHAGSPKAKTVCRAALRGLGVTDDLLDFGEISGLSEDEITSIGDPTRLERLADALLAKFTPLIEEKVKKDPNFIGDVVDLLERYAVILSRSAESTSPGRDSRYTARALHAKAYLWFRVSWLISHRNPSVNRLKPSGRSSRTFIWTCLHLAATGMDDASTDDFLHRARQACNRLTMRMYRYASERADLLIVEAAVARFAACREPDAAKAGLALKRSARLLERAGDVMPADSSRPRLRARLLLERACLSVTLAEYRRWQAKDEEEGNKASKGHVKLAEADIASAQAMGHPRNEIFYSSRAKSLDTRLNKALAWPRTVAERWI